MTTITRYLHKQIHKRVSAGCMLLTYIYIYIIPIPIPGLKMLTKIRIQAHNPSRICIFTIQRQTAYTTKVALLVEPTETL